jgi:uncharacterized protein YabE (DUF348 family)/3D (Asp-Asp-Asp) domain-containing protein
MAPLDSRQKEGLNMPKISTLTAGGLGLKKTMHRMAALALIVMLTVVTFVQPAQAQTTYVITDGDTVLVYTTSSSDPTSVLMEAGISLGESDTVTLQNDGENPEIVIQRAQLISVNYGTQLMMVGSYGETVSELLERQNIRLGELDRIDCDLTEQTYDGMDITITLVRQQTIETEEDIPYETVIYEDNTLAEGAEVVLTEGQDGVVRTTYQITYENNAESERTVISQTVLTEAVDEVKLSGTDRSVADHNEHLSETDAVDYTPAASAVIEEDSTIYSSASSAAASAVVSSNSGTVTTSSTTATLNGSTVTTSTGETLTVQQVLSCEATAYTCPGYVGITATGTTARVGAIAVDPSVIPLGSKLYIVSNDGLYVYGYCTAEDTGGAIKGNIVDLYFNTWDECIQFGRRGVTVYVLS